MSAISLTAEQVIQADLGRKLADDISAACSGTISLMPSPNGKFVVATYGAACAIAWAAAALNEMLGEKASPTECIEALFEQLRPMAIAAVESARP